MSDVTLDPTKRGHWTSDQEVRWCPGCGDYGILAAMQFMHTELAQDPATEVKTEDTVFVSGIGCAARFPYYMDTYGMHTIHGRSPAIATGLAVARPDLSVWVVGGDGDMLSIGGNHLIHALRRNVNLTILLFNNQIYGLTKGQYSPTSEIGKVTKSTPDGSIDRPFNPISLAIGAQATFVARTHDLDRKHMINVFKQAHAHRGAALVEIYQNCNVFNDGAFDAITKRSNRDSMMIDLVDGEPIRFGPNNELGVQIDYGHAKVVEVDSVGIDALVVHRNDADPSVSFALAELAKDRQSPTCFGVFRSVEAPEYTDLLEAKVSAAQSNGAGQLSDLLRSGATWTV
ncbi:MAG: 2-oxoacid:ferredoxin oxidoreductase subunit beta [Acidimicrobiia bacterium]|nr:2-oxoacid:ferredoxin oxidoreductase subunit beta [Acidimicrobiia bacterium]